MPERSRDMPNAIHFHKSGGPISCGNWTPGSSRRTSIELSRPLRRALVRLAKTSKTGGTRSLHCGMSIRPMRRGRDCVDHKFALRAVRGTQVCACALTEQAGVSAMQSQIENYRAKAKEFARLMIVAKSRRHSRQYRKHMNYVRIGSLSVAKALHEFIQQGAAPGTSISAEAFWSGFAGLLRECGRRNRQLLQVRVELQSRIDQYHRERSGEPLDLSDYERFLRDIRYVLPEGNDFTIRTTNVDDEIAVVAGPQLVVPLSNARYALNA